MSDNSVQTQGRAGIPAYPTDALAVTLDAPFPQGAAHVYVGGAGNVTGVTAKGSLVTFYNVPAGSTVPCQMRRVNTSGTSASAMTWVFD